MLSLLSRTTLAALLVVLVLSVGPAPAAPARATVAPVLISPADGRDHFGPDVAALPRGGAVVVWQAVTGGAAGSEIVARRLAADGAPIGPPIAVNAAPAGEQRRPAVAALPDGGFVVAWDTDTRSVWARRFGPDGAPRDAADIAVAPTAGFDPDVAALPGGGFVVAWEQDAATASEVLLRRFGPDGTPAGAAASPAPPAPVARMNPALAAAPDGAAASPAPPAPVARMNPALAAAPDGALAIVWEETGAVRLTRLAPSGAPVVTAALVAAAASAELRDPAVALDAAGVASVAWAVRPPADPAAGRVELRRLDATGAPLGPAVAVSGASPAERAAPALAGDAWGALVAWADGATAQGGITVGLAARALDEAGAPDGAERYPRLPLAAAEPVAVVAVAASSAGAWVVWSQERIGEGADAGAVYARRLAATGTIVYIPVVARGE